MSEKTNHGSNYKIYCYSNLFNGKRYIGQTYQTLERRAGKDGNNYKKHCLYFGNAIKKDGWENFIPEILESGLTLEEANEREEYWIKRMNTQNSKYGYNIAFGGNNHNHPLDVRQRMSEKRKGKPHSKEWNESISKSHIGKKMSYEAKEHMREAAIGKYLNRPDISKVVQQFTKDGQFVAEYPSTAEAQRQTGIDSRNIRGCCSRKNKSAGGFVWKYK